MLCMAALGAVCRSLTSAERFRRVMKVRQSKSMGGGPGEEATDDLDDAGGGGGVAEELCTGCRPTCQRLAGTSWLQVDVVEEANGPARETSRQAGPAAQRPIARSTR